MGEDKSERRLEIDRKHKVQVEDSDVCADESEENQHWSSREHRSSLFYNT